MPTFRRNILSPSSGLKKLRKTASPTCDLHHHNFTGSKIILVGSDHLRDVNVDGRIILKFILDK
jgi:hypothetical protein